ncbi:hypothetical protein VPH35_138479 [Triticum aestivum]
MGLASLERTIACQRARIASLQDGDANTSFFHRQCSYRRQKNRIHSLAVDGQVLTGHDDMVAATFAHFDELLGTATHRECTLNLAQLIEPADDLLELDAPFTDDEIWNAVKRLPARKAPGPDGFTAEFLRACWPIVKDDFAAVFQQLYNMRGRGFFRLNEALLSLLPKHADARGLRDYRPISLVHVVAKIFAKVLSLRLAPKLDSLVGNNQNAFISGRNLHDNFVLVRQSARLLHQLGAPHILLKLDLARAFDSLSWPFLFEVLRQYGFGDRFLEWLAILLSSASTKVLRTLAPQFGIARATPSHLSCSSSPWTFLGASSSVLRTWESCADCIPQDPSRQSRCMRTTSSCSAIPTPTTWKRSRPSCTCSAGPLDCMLTTPRALPRSFAARLTKLLQPSSSWVARSSRSPSPTWASPSPSDDLLPRSCCPSSTGWPGASPLGRRG